MTNLNLATSHASRILHVVQNGLQPAGIEPHVTRSWYRCCVNTASSRRRRGRTRYSNPSPLKELQQRMGECCRWRAPRWKACTTRSPARASRSSLPDTQGAVLTTITDPTLKREFRQAGLCARRAVGRAHEGTNGLGTCVAEGCRGDDASRRAFHAATTSSLSCSGAPIIDAHGGAARRARCLDRQLATTPRDPAPHDGAGQHVGEPDLALEFPARVSANAWILRFHSRPEFVGLLHEALVAVDGDGPDPRGQRKRADAARPSGRARRWSARRSKKCSSSSSPRSTSARTTEPQAIWPMRDLRPRPPFLRARARAAAAGTRTDGRAGSRRAVRNAPVVPLAEARHSAMSAKIRRCARTSTARGSCSRKQRADPAAGRDRHRQGSVRAGAAPQRRCGRQARSSRSIALRFRRA